MADTYEALGLLPHDLARDLLDADLRWGEAAGYGELHRRVRAHRVPWAQKSRGIEQQRACTDMLFLYRTNPVISSFGDWASLGQAYSDVLSPGDRKPILAMAERHEGPGSAALVALLNGPPTRRVRGLPWSGWGRWSKALAPSRFASSTPTCPASRR